MSFSRRQDETRCFWSHHDEVRCQSHTGHLSLECISPVKHLGALVNSLEISPPSWVIGHHNCLEAASRDHPCIGPHTFDPYHWLNHSWWIWDSTRRSSVATCYRQTVSPFTHRIIVSPRGDLMKNMENSCGKTWRRKTKPLAFPSEILRPTIQL